MDDIFASIGIVFLSISYIVGWAIAINYAVQYTHLESQCFQHNYCYYDDKLNVVWKEALK